MNDVIVWEYSVAEEAQVEDGHLSFFRDNSPPSTLEIRVSFPDKSIFSQFDGELVVTE